MGTQWRLFLVAEPAPLSLLQITDMHLQQDLYALKHGMLVEERFQRVMQSISVEQADLLLLTGDLTDHAPGAYKRLSDQLQLLPFPSYWIPGNHDLIDEMAPFSSLGLNRKVIVQQRWRIILLDSTSQPDGKGGGALARDELMFLEAELLKSQPDQHLLIVLHHNPVPINSQWQDKISLKNQQAFWSLIECSSQVKGIIFGHVHQACELVRGSIKLFSSPATAPQFKPQCDHPEFEVDPRFSGPAYTRYQLYDNGDINVKVVRLSA